MGSPLGMTPSAFKVGFIIKKYDSKTCFKTLSRQQKHLNNVFTSYSVCTYV